jgi:hypothetical protein
MRKLIALALLALAFTGGVAAEEKSGLETVPTITLDEKLKHKDTLNGICMYAEQYSIYKDSQWLYFKGGSTPGNICSNDLWSYKWHLENVTSIGPAQQCRTNPTVFYKQVCASAP